MEYAVGPIPNPTRYEPFQLPGWTQDIPYAARTTTAPTEILTYLTVLATELGKINDVIETITSGYRSDMIGLCVLLERSLVFHIKTNMTNWGLP